MRKRQRSPQLFPAEAPLQKLAYSVAEAAKIMSMGVTKMRDTLDDKEIKVVRLGRLGPGHYYSRNRTPIVS